MDTVGEEENEMDGESSINIYSLKGIRWIAGEKMLYSTGSPVWCSLITWRDGMGEGTEAREGADVCIIMADLHCYMAETNTTL